MKKLLIAAALTLNAAPALAQPPACSLYDREPFGTCIFNGAGGWQAGLQWRLAEVDAPSIDPRYAGCQAEQIVGVKARDRLRQLMARGYTITDTALRDRAQVRLVRLTLRDGRDAGLQMLSEGLVQAVPHTGNRWCEK